MRRVSLIGIGAGDPEYVTVQAIKALNRTDVFFLFDKGEDKDDLLHLRREICERYIDHDRYRMVEVRDAERDLGGPVYGDAVGSWHQQRVGLSERLLGTELADGETGAFLLWGDPTLYDSTLRVLETVRARGMVELELDVVPGISAIQALVARHQIPLNRVGGPVLVTTGRALLDGWRKGVDDVVVMLDSHCTFEAIEPRDTVIYWGAYLGTTDEILISGTIADRAEEIKEVRAAARARKGWVFDTYLLRRN